MQWYTEMRERRTARKYQKKLEEDLAYIQKKAEDMDGREHMSYRLQNHMPEQKRSWLDRVLGLKKESKRHVHFWEDDYRGRRYDDLDLNKAIWWVDIWDKIPRAFLFRLNQTYYRLGDFVVGMIWIRWTDYEARSFFIYVSQLLSSNICWAVVGVSLRVYFDMTNLLLLLSLAYFLPFLRSTTTLTKFLPCPLTAALVCDSALLAMFLVFGFLAQTISSNFFYMYVFISMTWPWMVGVSMLARIFVGQKKRQFHPFKHLPFLATLGIMGHYFFALAIKSKIQITDMLVFICCIDPLVSGVLTPLILDRERAVTYFAFSKLLAGMGALAYWYYSARSNDPYLSSGVTYITDNPYA